MSIYHDDTRTGQSSLNPKESVGWSPAQATEQIRAIAVSHRLSLSYKVHATQRLNQRGLFVSDILHVLKRGFVYDWPTPATRPGYFRYLIQCLSPNGGDRTIGVVVIPDSRGCSLKIVTVMWMDETSSVAGTVLE